MEATLTGSLHSLIKRKRNRLLTGKSDEKAVLIISILFVLLSQDTELGTRGEVIASL